MNCCRCCVKDEEVNNRRTVTFGIPVDNKQLLDILDKINTLEKQTNVLSAKLNVIQRMI